MENCYRAGLANHVEWNLYCDWHTHLLGALGGLAIDGFVYLRVSPEVRLVSPDLGSMLPCFFFFLMVLYVFVIAWVFDFRKFITITDVSLQAMYIACAPIASICSQHGFTHERLTKYLIPWGVE